MPFHVPGLRRALFTDSYAPQVNGVARTLERLVSVVHVRGGAVLVFAPHDPKAVASPDIERFRSRAFWAYPQLRLPCPSATQVHTAVEAFAPTLVHAATAFGMGLVGRRSARALGIPFISSYHTSFVAYAEHYGLCVLARPGWHFMRWFHDGGLRTYCPTQSVVNEVNVQGFECTTVWSRGVDGERFSPRHRSAAFRDTLVQTPGTLVLSYVRRLAAEKGLDVALEAVQRVERLRPGAVVADGRRWFVQKSATASGAFGQGVHGKTAWHGTAWRSTNPTSAAM